MKNNRVSCPPEKSIGERRFPTLAGRRGARETASPPHRMIKLLLFLPQVKCSFFSVRAPLALLSFFFPLASMYTFSGSLFSPSPAAPQRSIDFPSPSVRKGHCVGPTSSSSPAPSLPQANSVAASSLFSQCCVPSGHFYTLPPFLPLRDRRTSNALPPANKRTLRNPPSTTLRWQMILETTSLFFQPGPCAGTAPPLFSRRALHSDTAFFSVFRSSDLYNAPAWLPVIFSTVTSYSYSPSQT